MPSQQIVIYKIMPTEPGKEEEIIKQLEKLSDITIKDTKIEPVAFGLKAIKIAVVTEAKEGISESILEKLKSSLKDVESVTVEGITLL